MTKVTKQEIDDFIIDWHWDKQTYEYAYDMGKFLMGFHYYLDTLGLSERSLKKHRDNIFFVGVFDAQYGFKNEGAFNIENLEGGASHEYEFSRKVSDSPTALATYRATCNYLDKYIKSKAYLDFVIDIK